ncbi:MAG: 50S ribosomal protein L35 [Ruminococcus sp.]|jgi:large subunit ribosomal protein L35|nr:50S ribosomal protein L35 [Ruminococcus sp.]
MIKQKSHSGAKKRFSITGKGKVKFQHANKLHRRISKTHKSKRIARNAGMLSPANAATMKILIPYK